jgi:hypothetical protein
MLRCDSARQLLFRLLVATSVLLAAACGQGVAFGVAPGPPPPDPPPPPPPPPQDAGPDPVEDSGPPPPPTDAGQLCTTENRAATAAETLAEFSAQGLPGAYGCASCHQGKTPSGSGIGWGAATNDAAGWEAAALALEQRDSALGPQAGALYLHFDDTGDTTHPENATAKAGMLEWIDLVRNGVDEVVCEDPPPEECPSTFRDPTPAEIEADFTTRNITADYSCASCHQGKSPTGTGIGWGAPTNDVAGWFAACDALAERDAASPINQTALYLHFDETGDGTHPANTAARDRMNAWLTYRRSQIEEPGVCEEPDAGPGLDCTPVAVDAAGSEAEFIAQDLPTPYNNCANCHVGKSPSGSGINWGPDNNNPTPADWHTAARTLWDSEGLTDPTQSELYAHFNGTNATHPANADAAAALEAWLDYISSPQPPEGCE